MYGASRSAVVMAARPEGDGNTHTSLLACFWEKKCQIICLFHEEMATLTLRCSPFFVLERGTNHRKGPGRGPKMSGLATKRVNLFQWWIEE
jgi:hypothetical protein